MFTIISSVLMACILSRKGKKLFMQSNDRVQYVVDALDVEYYNFVREVDQAYYIFLS
jgi:hypothetical protein